MQVKAVKAKHHKIYVCFFVENETDEPLAVFPQFEEPGGLLTCYARVGQHAAAAKAYIDTLDVARQDQYAPLLDELQKIYDDCELVVLDLSDRRYVPISDDEEAYYDLDHISPEGDTR